MSKLMRSLVVISLLAASVPAAGERSPKRARVLFEEGTKHYNLGEYQKALDAFKAAYYDTPDSAFLFNLGQCYRMLGDTESSVRQYRAFLRERPDAPNRAEVERLVEDGEATLRSKAAGKPPTGVAPPAAPVVSTDITAPKEPTRNVRTVVIIAVASVVVVGAAVGITLAATLPSNASVPQSDFGPTQIHF